MLNEGLEGWFSDKRIEAQDAVMFKDNEGGPNKIGISIVVNGVEVILERSEVAAAHRYLEQDYMACKAMGLKVI